MKYEDKTVEYSQIAISFCLPVYNVEKFLKACIESIVSQIDKTISFEIVCVDDKSTDGSYALLKRLQIQYPVIKAYINDENKGVSYTRNRAIDLAKGKYIWFVDPDDMLYPGVVHNLYKEIEQRNGNVILGNFIKVPEDAELSSYDKEPHYTVTEIATNDNGYLPSDTNGNVMCSVWAGMFNKSFLIDNHLYFQEGMIAQEDTLLYYQFSLRTDVVIKYNGILYIYRQCKSSVMHSRNSERSKKYYNSMVIMYDVYNAHYKNKDYRDEMVLLKKLHHMRQNLASVLALVDDSDFVKRELKRLKQQKLYPYPLRWSAIKGKDSLVRRIIIFLLPIEPIFWLSHKIFKIIKKG